MRDLVALLVVIDLVAGPLVVGVAVITAAVIGRAAMATAALGDLVTDDGDGCHLYHGRRDRMVKKRGYRIELGEIEAALYRHEGVDRAAVIARNTEDGASLVAFVAMKPGRKGSIIALKRHCTRLLPPYMVPDEVQFLNGLPTTSTDKVDYQGLKKMASAAGG